MTPGRLFWTAYLLRHLRGQARYPFRPLAAIRRDQAGRVRRMVAYAHRYVPYYRETLDRLGLTPADFRTADDLARLPVLEREQVREDPERFCSRAVRERDCLRVSTAGSTGTPIWVRHDLRALLQGAAHAERHRAVLRPLLGRRFGYREFYVGSPVSTVAKVRQFCLERLWWPAFARTERVMMSMDAPVEEVVRRLNETRPDLVWAYGSYYTLLLSHVRATGAALHRPKAFVYISDNLPLPVRRFMTEEMGVPVSCTYGATEAFQIGFECEAHGGVHLNLDLHPVRIVDAAGRSLPPGETGEVLVSNLVNRAMVFLNYRLRDLAALLPDPCPCGRCLPLLSFPQGRLDDLLPVPPGRVLHPQLVRALLEELLHVWEYQVTQDESGQIRILVVPPPGCDPDQLLADLKRHSLDLLGPDVSVDFSFVSSIPRTAGGKLRAIVSMRCLARMAWS